MCIESKRWSIKEWMWPSGGHNLTASSSWLWNWHFTICSISKTRFFKVFTYFWKQSYQQIWMPNLVHFAIDTFPLYICSLFIIFSWKNKTNFFSLLVASKYLSMKLMFWFFLVVPQLCNHWLLIFKVVSPVKLFLLSTANWQVLI